MPFAASYSSVSRVGRKTRLKFLLLDYSLDRVGGHNYEYDRLCLEAVQDLGLEPVLAAQRAFRDPFSQAASWDVHSVFPRGKYSAHRLGQRLARLDAASGGPTRWLARSLNALRQWYYLREHGRFHRNLAKATSKLFAQLDLCPGDQVYLPTISVSDLPGLAEFLQRDAAARQLDWHLQFHLPLSAGDSAADPQASPMWSLAERWLADCVRAMPDRLHLYATTESLAAQYSTLGPARFRHLPWLVDPAFHAPGSTTNNPEHRPLRLLCSGGMRKEKGFGELPAILESMWAEYFLSGRMQLVVQSTSLDALPAAWQPHAALEPGAADRVSAPIAVSPFPMESERYQQFVRSADVGLLLYEPEAYSIRCSGICLEMLCAGVPIVVREGTWLAEQVRQGSAKVAGEVGGIARSPQDVPQQLRRLADHYADHRRSARQFSRVLAQRHHPKSVMQRLLDTASNDKRAVA